jgi:glycosyltransferase involved in cell wall biosynthesis
VEERVLFLGAVAPTDVWGLLSLSTAYVSASEFEGRPNALLEALASGIPAFVSDIPSHRTLVTEGENGRLFELNGGAQEALLQMLRDSEKLVGMGQNARVLMKDASWKNTAIRYRELFELVAKGN